jgi:hypothetical protein
MFIYLVIYQVPVTIPGTWFENTSAAERKKKFEGFAVEYAKEHAFDGRLYEALRFHVVADVDDDANHPGKPKPT